jgi:arginine decarboxylase
MYPEEKLTVAIIDDAIHTETPHGRTMRRIVSSLQEYGLIVGDVSSPADARAAASRLPGVDCILINLNLGGDLSGQSKYTSNIIHEIRKRNEDIPIFLLAEPTSESPGNLTIDIIKEVNEYIYVMEDSADFLAGRIAVAARRYRTQILPPFFSELINFSRDFEYSWHTPGHAGGTAFHKTPVGRVFYQFFGEELFRSDLSISVGELGSLLDHSGPIGKAEKYASKVFGSDLTYFVTNGTSTANKIVFFGSVTEGDIVLVDRNCHKSAEHALTMTHSVPVYLIPSRNRYGIIGPIYPDQLTPDSIRKKIEDCPFTRFADSNEPVHAVITNSTYDGLCYHAAWVERLLGQSVPRIHFDEAWYAYARFNPIYKDRFAMRDDAKDRNGPTVFATQSTHKLLAALSQASMIHVRNGRAPIEHSRFNEGFMMHTSTSPLYTIIASCDVSAKMMDGPSGKILTDECIEEAIRFRRTMARIQKELCGSSGKNDWWFKMWQPEHITDPVDGQKKAFEEASIETLRDNPSCWVLHPGDIWHGFEGLSDDYCMLDPIKVTVLTPGVNDGGGLDESGIPAALVVKFLDTRGIINEKSGDYSILFLFSVGITKGKWGTLITELFEFKRLYDENTPLDEVFPDLIEKYPDRYNGMTLPELAKEMHAFKKDNKMLDVLSEAFSLLPEPVITFADAYKRLVRGVVEQVPVDSMKNRVVATGVVPYPPGIPLLLPGERAGDNTGPILQYLKGLQDFDNKFPGFEHDTHGVEVSGGRYMITCIKEEKI